MSSAMNPLSYQQPQYGYNANSHMINAPQYYPAQHQHQKQSYIQNFLQPPQPQGGVCESIDYDFKMMTEFVVQNAYLTFNKEIISDFDDKTMENSDVVEIFTNGVNFVLKSIRLPQSTIYLALNYLHKGVNKLKKTSKDSSLFVDAAENVIYQNLVIALVLANKFNDDKTFTNKSWAQATGMDLETINKMEREWLKAFNWSLNDATFETKLMSEYEKSFEIYSNAMSFRRESTHSASAILNNNSTYNHFAVAAPTAVPTPSFEIVDSSPLLNYNYCSQAPSQQYQAVPPPPPPQPTQIKQDYRHEHSVTPVSAAGVETPIALPSMLNNSSNNYFFSSPMGPSQNEQQAYNHSNSYMNDAVCGASSPLNFYPQQFSSVNYNMPIYHQQQQPVMPAPMHMQMPANMQPHLQVQMPVPTMYMNVFQQPQPIYY